MDPRVATCRAELDAIDREVLALLARRRELVRALFALKDAQGVPRLDAARERALLDARRELSVALGLPPELSDQVFRAVLASSHALP